MKKLSIVVLFLFCFTIIFSNSIFNNVQAKAAKLQTSKYTAVSGTSLKFIPADGFTPAKDFIGYQNLPKMINVIVREISITNGKPTLNDIYTTYTKDYFEKQGVTLVSKTYSKNSGNNALIVKCTGNQYDVPFTQWFYYLTGKSGKIAEIQFNGSTTNFSKSEKEITSMLSSFKWTTASFAKTSYSISIPKGWKIAKQSGFVNYYSVGGKQPKSVSDVIAISNLSSIIQSSKRKAFIADMNTNTSGYSNFKVLKSTNLKINKQAANISYVSATNNSDKKTYVFQYCYIFLDSSTYLISGYRTSSTPDKSFEKMVKSWKYKK